MKLTSPCAPSVWSDLWPSVWPDCCLILLLLCWVEFVGSVGGVLMLCWDSCSATSPIVHFRWHHLSGHSWRDCHHASQRLGQRAHHLFSIYNPDLHPPPPHHQAALFPHRSLSVWGSRIHHGPVRSFLSNFINLASPSPWGGEDHCCLCDLKLRGHRVKPKTKTLQSKSTLFG